MATNWLEKLKTDPTQWLLTQDDPMVRYLTQRWILEREDRAESVRAARQEAALHPRIETLLAGQSTGGWWEDPALFVGDYYYGAAWRLILAAELGAVRTPAISKGVEYLFRVAQSRDGGGFSHRGSPRRGGTIGGQWACLTGSVIEMLFRFGYGDDPRTQRALGFLVSRQQTDGLYPCENFSPNNSTLPLNCYMGSIKPLRMVLAVPHRRRSPGLRLLAERTVTTLLNYGLDRYKRADSGRPAHKKDWLEFGFPRFWNTDLLEVTWLMARLGYGSHPALQPALQIILDKQLKNGKWKLDFEYNERLPLTLGKRNTSSPWITLRALHTLRLCSSVSKRQPA